MILTSESFWKQRQEGKDSIKDKQGDQAGNVHSHVPFVVVEELEHRRTVGEPCLVAFGWNERHVPPLVD